MSHSGVWGNPLGFAGEAMQVQSILYLHCEHCETGDCKMTLPPLRLSSTKLVVEVLILFDVAMTELSSNHTESLSVFSPPTVFLQAAAPKMSGQIIRPLIGNLERMFSSQKPGSVCRHFKINAIIPLLSP